MSISKVCLIADAGEMLGKEVGILLSKQGTKLVLNFDSESKIDKDFLNRLDAINAAYKVTVSDLKSFDAAKSVLEQIKDDSVFGHLDAMFYNVAPAVRRQSVSEMPREMLEELINDYILKAYSATKVFGDYMGELGGGTIIYRSSVNADKPTGIAGFNAMYYAAIKNLNREAALFYGYFNIKTIALEFGAFAKEDEEYHNDISTFYDGYDVKIPSGYVGKPEDFASLISYLISDECNSINGAEIRVDNGLLFQYIEPVMNIKIHERLRREGKE